VWESFSLQFWMWNSHIWISENISDQALCQLCFRKPWHQANNKSGFVQSRGTARMRPKKPCPPRKSLLSLFFAGVSYQSHLFENKRKNSRTHVVSCSLTDLGLTRLFCWCLHNRKMFIHIYLSLDDVISP